MKLDGAWTLYYAPESDDMPMCPDQIAGSGMACITAQVPGNVEIDLMRAGLEQNPFYGENLYNFRKYEYYHWWYQKEFGLPNSFAGEQMELTLHGVNTIAEVFVNDTLVGKCDDMMIEHRFRVEKALRPGDFNTISVHILSAMNYARELESPVVVSGEEHTDELSLLRMPPHSFGWDIMPRLLSAGLWRSVSLDIVNPTRITQSYYATISASEDEAELMIKCRFTTPERVMQGYRLHVQGACGNSVFEYDAPARFVSEEGRVKIKNPKLWWPRGYGEQNLYTVKMELLHNGEVADVRMERIGIRRFHIDHVMKPLDEGEFKVRCNGVPILCKGSNWVPLDALHSRDEERYDRAMALMADMGCNIVRCWGGNVVEDHHFFNLCDELGIMVWQDFTMACANYPQQEWFFRLIEKEVTSIVMKLRNHPSILLWAGDNEVDERSLGMGFEEGNSTNEITRVVIPRVIRNHDPYRKYLPSSPYIPEGFPRYAGPEQHNWGARAYFKDDFYKHSQAHFISECGYHGCPAPESLKKFIPEDQLWPILGDDDAVSAAVPASGPASAPTNDVWDTHNTEDLQKPRRGYNRNRMMADQVRILCGSVPADLETFSRISQISQAEAKKFFVERTRIKKWRRTGIIWWNMLDGWPQISDAIVDYYFNKKLAYTWLKRVHEPVCLMLDELQDWGRNVVLGNDSRQDKTVEWSVRNGDSGEVLLQGKTLSPANENVVLGNIRELAGAQKLYLLTWTVDGKVKHNHYISGFPPYDAQQLLSWADRIEHLDEE